jgi:hypothetical protein
MTAKLNPMHTTYWITRFSLALALLIPMAVSAGSIRGVLKDDQGHPIRNAEVCLLSAASAAKWQCIKSRHSASKGKYAFANLKKGIYYVSVRRIDTMGPSYAWLPALQQVVLKKSTSVAKAVDFGWISQGASQGFKFNNFKNDRRLTAADFPELAQFDTAHARVALKVYIPAPNETTEEQVLFLGRIVHPEHLAISLSIPNTETRLVYEIFTPSQTAAGTLIVQ